MVDDDSGMTFDRATTTYEDDVSLAALTTRQPRRMSRHLKIILDVLVICLVVGVLAFLRLYPVFDQGVQLHHDSVLNFRITEQWVESGQMPDHDRLSNYPAGRSLKAHLPPGMYGFVFFANKIVSAISNLPLDQVIFLLTALAGSLIVVPVFFLGMGLGFSRWQCYTAMVLAGTLPVYIERTMSYYFRHEVYALPLLFLGLWLSFKALTARHHKVLFLFLMSACFLGSVYTWRLSVFFIAALIVVLLREFLATKGSHQIIFAAMACLSLVLASTNVKLLLTFPGTLRKS